MQLLPYFLFLSITHLAKSLQCHNMPIDSRTIITLSDDEDESVDHASTDILRKINQVEKPRPEFFPIVTPAAIGRCEKSRSMSVNGILPKQTALKVEPRSYSEPHNTTIRCYSSSAQLGGISKPFLVHKDADSDGAQT